MHKLVLILKGGRSVVLTSSGDEKELANCFAKILADIKDNQKFITIDNEGEISLVRVEEIATLQISPCNRKHTTEQENE